MGNPIHMSHQSLPRKKTTVSHIRQRKNDAPIVCLTSYSAPITSLLDKHVDLLLVGDSVAMVHHGHTSTLPITLDEMIYHGRAVMRANPKSLVVIDLPFGTYEASPQQAHETSVRVLQETGADAIKLEGGELQAATIEFPTQRGIPVLAHVGLQPQSVMATGGYKIVGKTAEQETQFMRDARAVEQAGAFAVVFEGVIESLAAQATKELSIPTIGIGASVHCDGQILVTDDMLGIFERTPKFVKKYADLHTIIDEAVETYAKDVSSRSFPSENEIYSADGSNLKKLVKKSDG